MAVGGSSSASEDENSRDSSASEDENSHRDAEQPQNLNLKLCYMFYVGFGRSSGWLEQENRAFNQGGE